MRKFILYYVVLVLVLVLMSGTAQAVLVITNGDFNDNAPTSNVTNVEKWFDPQAATPGNWWEATWYGPTVSPNGTSVMGLSWMWATSNWAYQNIGVNDGGLTDLTIQFDVGSFTDAGGARDMGITVEIYQLFTPGDNADIAGGLQLIDSVSQTSGALLPGEEVTLTATFDLTSANATDDLYLRFSNYATATGDPWASIDNVKIIPEPATMVLLGLGSLALLRRKRS